ncbi:lipase family protein [Gallaecimonas pentaromativorans]|uniref:Lipase (Class 3) n=1 Tax=Gallaecimonas pentaromativorans TaxID=584787 RepID=A0A3N1NRQ1_9GAMM|nr:lipase family protein [Gallaecimonas pentaromativorans]ROQ18855.1 lipase (class 3) [Gallaecimonas pentaromativorans]
MSFISPKVASQLALLTYSAENRSANGRYNFAPSADIRRIFDLESEALTGKSGFALFRKTLGFSLVGKGKAEFEGDHVIAMRGTNMKNVVDALTDANFGMASADNGSAAHFGFVRTFDSIKPGLKAYLDANPGRGAVHCVGHSLGGALATLAADWVAINYGRPAYLYTFGCPRVGQAGFARSATANIDRIYRCTHGADVVPKVPLWPFQHIPAGGTEYRLDGSQGFSMAAHSMGYDGSPGYVNTASKGGWDELHQNSERFMNTPVRLDFDKRLNASFTSYWADKIGAALITLLKDAGYYAAVAAQMALATSFTVYDILAQTIEKIAQAGTKLAAQAKGLIGHMLVFAGKVAGVVINLTAAFIRGVFDLMLKALGRMVRNSLKLLD